MTIRAVRGLSLLAQHAVSHARLGKVSVHCAVAAVVGLQAA